jgi:hypothetical protein
MLAITYSARRPCHQVELRNSLVVLPQSSTKPVGFPAAGGIDVAQRGCHTSKIKWKVDRILNLLHSDDVNRGLQVVELGEK